MCSLKLDAENAHDLLEELDVRMGEDVGYGKSASPPNLCKRYKKLKVQGTLTLQPRIYATYANAAAALCCVQTEPHHATAEDSVPAHSYWNYSSRLQVSDQPSCMPMQLAVLMLR